MKKKIAILSLGLVSFGFCVDEYQPIAPKTTEIDVGYNPVFGTGSYDTSGTKHSNPSGISPMTNNIGAQVKYGIMENLDAEASWFFQTSNKDASIYGKSVTGFGGQGFVGPDVAVKYALSQYGVGFYLDVVIPLVTGDYSKFPGHDTSGADLGIAPGIVYGKNFGKFQAVGRAQYLLNFENGDKITEPNQLWVYLKPGYSITDALGAYLGLNYTMFGDFKLNGTKQPNFNGANGYLISVNPGATFTQNKMLSYELNVPVTLAGENQGASWGSRLGYMLPSVADTNLP